MKLNLCLQLCPLDQEDGLKLVRLICDIEKERRKDVEFTLCVRRDTDDSICKDIISLAKTKFTNVFFIRSKRNATGWPHGPNELWSEAMTQVETMHKNGSMKSTGTLTFEADCTPLRPDWIDRLCDEWERAQSLGKLVVGHEHQFEGKEKSHINGNAIFHNAIMDKHGALCGSDPTWGWDAFHGALLLKIGTDTDMIWQKYRMKEVSKEEFVALRKNGVIPALFHGIKNGRGIELANEMIASGEFFTRNYTDKKPEPKIKK